MYFALECVEPLDWALPPQPEGAHAAPHAVGAGHGELMHAAGCCGGELIEGDAPPGDTGAPPKKAGKRESGTGGISEELLRTF